MADQNAEDQVGAYAYVAAQTTNMEVNYTANNKANQAIQNHNCTLRELLLPRNNATCSCIVFPDDVGNFHFRNGMIQLIRTCENLRS